MRSSSTHDRTYKRHLADLLASPGQFVLIRGDEVGGVFPTYAAAAVAWMTLYGPVPALIRRIDGGAIAIPVATLGQPMTVACQWALTSAPATPPKTYWS